jgi:hypothetical protein
MHTVMTMNSVTAIFLSMGHLLERRKLLPAPLRRRTELPSAPSRAHERGAAQPDVLGWNVD